MFGKLKRLIVGKALPTEQAVHERLTKKVALAVFSSDALSSTAYATEEILLVLAVAVAFGNATAFSYVVPISIAIAVLLIIVGVRDNGTEISMAYKAEPLSAAATFRYYAEAIDKVYGEIAPTAPERARLSSIANRSASSA